MTQARTLSPRRILALLLLPFAAACASDLRPMRELPPPAPASYFTAPARQGDSVKDLALRYRVKEDDLVAMNDFSGGKVSGASVRIPAYGLRDVPPPALETPARTDTAPLAKAAPPRVAPRTPVATRALEAPRPVASKTDTPRVAEAASKPNAVAPAQTEQSSWFGSWFGQPEPTEMPAQKFLWPVNGEVLSNFGQSASGQRNDGINISAPRGTPVKAADTGTVTYVGNELKGYGNLVLIRHDSGYITAYAHSERVTVERGMRVARGQIIAYAGETGDVSQPQVHFEVRVGTRPVDPKPYLVASK